MFETLFPEGALWGQAFRCARHTPAQTANRGYAPALVELQCRVRFSFVTPAFNEEKLLPRLLDTVDVARERYPGGADAIEVIVADNCSTDGTASIATARGCRVVRVEKRRIGAVRNRGAAAATGEILCFCDADMRIHPRTFEVIEETLASPRVIGGATGVTLERWSLGIAATYALLVPLVVVMRMDTGVVFCRREDSVAIGGYGETRRFAEDVEFLMALRRLGRGRGQRLARATRAKALTSMRKFDEHGDCHYFTLMGKAAGAMMGGEKRVADFADDYWYRPKR
jgi:glycosyltransferase involved in cell wall biosynthesis